MVLLSRKTCSELLVHLEQELTHSDIAALLYEQNVSQDMQSSGNKKDRLLAVFEGMERRKRFDDLLSFTLAGIAKLSPDSQAQMKAALLRDGFVLDSGGIAADENLATEHKGALAALVNNHAANLDRQTLLHHLREAEELFRLEKWDSSISHARKFVEQLLSDIAQHIAKVRCVTPDLSRPVKVRDYLQQSFFFDQDERKKLVDGVYGYFSGEGSHPGIGVQSTARVCLSILWNFGYYVLEKLSSLKP